MKEGCRSLCIAAAIGLAGSTIRWSEFTNRAGVPSPRLFPADLAHGRRRTDRIRLRKSPDHALSGASSDGNRGIFLRCDRNNLGGGATNDPSREGVKEHELLSTRSEAVTRIAVNSRRNPSRRADFSETASAERGKQATPAAAQQGGSKRYATSDRIWGPIG